MTARSRTFRIFVSSTFQDLKEERSALREKVFPRLRELCAQHSARFQAIDLRWGVSEEASVDQQTMNICLGEIERCQQVTPRPNFILLLGDRYGWCPPPPQIPAAEFEQILTVVHDPSDRGLLQEWYSRDENAVPPEYYLLPRAGDMTVHENWEPVELRLQHTLEEGARRLGLPPDTLTKYTTSATEQEIMKGALQICDAHDHVFGFFRSIEGLPDDESARAFIDLDKEGRWDTNPTAKLRDLKKRIGDTLPGNVHQYSAKWLGNEITLDHLSQLCEDVYQCLSEVILDEIRSGFSLPPSVEGIHHIPPNKALDEEGLAHHSFAEELVIDFVGRTDILGTIRDYVAATERTVPAVLVGEGGTGKSSVIARAIEQAHIDHPTAQIVYRFIGTTPDSSNVQGLLNSLCRELGRRYGMGDDKVPGDYRELVTDFITRLKGVSATACPLIIFLDALDQLSPQPAARSLDWIPDPLPKGVWVILSTRPGDIQRSLEQRRAHKVILEGLSPKEGNVLLGRWLEAVNRTLQEPQRSAVLERFNQSQGNPLYLRLAFEEARRWKSGSEEPPEQLALGIEGIIEQNLLGRLAKEDNHGEALVSHVLGYLAASRYGLSGDELLDLLSRDTQVYAWFLRSVFHYPQDILASALEYLRSRKPPFSDTDRASVHNEEAAAQEWLDEVRTREKELDVFLARVLAKPGGPRLPVVLWSRLYFDLQPYLSSTQAQGTSVLGFYHRELGEVASEQYLAGGSEVPYHRKMADYFRLISDPSGSGIWDGNQPRGLSELPYHLIKGARWDEVRGTLTDFRFLQAKTEALGLQRLIDDYDLARRNGFSEPGLRVIQEALQLSAHVLADDCTQLASQLTGRLLSTDLQPVRSLLDQAQGWDHPWLRPLTASLIQPGGPLLRTLVGHRSSIDRVAFAPDGQRIVSVSRDGSALTWDLEPEDELLVTKDAKPAEREWLNAVIVEDPNNRLTINLEHDIVEVQESGNEARKAALIGHNHAVTTYAFSPDGKKLVTGGEDYTVRVWELVHTSAEDTVEHPGGVTAVAAARGGARAISGGVDGTLRVWDLQTGIETATLVGHRDRISALSIAPDGQRAVSASSDATLKVWDLSKRVELLSLSGHNGSVTALAVTADVRHAVSAGKDQTLKAWDLASGGERSSVEGPQSWDPAIAIAPGGRLAAAAYRDHCLRVWDLDRGALVSTCIGHINTVNAVAFSPDGRRLASGSDDQTLRIWDAATGIERARLPGHWDTIRALDFPQIDRLVSLSEDDTVRVWDVRSGEEIHRLGGREVDPSRLSLPPAALRTGYYHEEPAFVSTTADGGRAVSFYVNDDTLRLWDLERGEQITAFTGDNVLTCSAIGEDASIVAGTLNGGIHLLRLEGGEGGPVSLSGTKGIMAKADSNDAPTAWRIELAGSEKQELVESGALSNENLRSFSVYRLIHPPTERLAHLGTVTLRGFLTCACGYEIPLEATSKPEATSGVTIGFEGFFNEPSQYNVTCQRCWRGNMLVGYTTQGNTLESYWLLVTPTSGKPGATVMPGTASGLPELKINRIEEIASEPAVPSKITEDDQKVSGQPEESIDHQLAGTERDEVRTELVAGDVLAMAIVYEGYVIEEPDAVEIANELLTNLSEAGVLTGAKLHLYSTIRIRRADEEAWYRGDYEPGDELPQMLDEGIGELRNRLLSDRRFLGQVNARTVKLKSWSRVVSTCWVGMHILQ
jgi:WD40 repeat protein